MPPIIRQILRDTRVKFDQAHVDSPASTARAIVARALDRSREWLIAHDDETPTDAACAHLLLLIQRVVSHEPLGYILGQREFYGLDFSVDARVLIPRPETEMLVEAALMHLRGSQIAAESAVDLIDVGTGSGAVAVAVAVHATMAKIVATDISSDALEVARLNAQRHDTADRIRFITADLLDGIDLKARVITANLPYVTAEEIEALPPEIQAHEPRVALDGGSDGLALVRRLLCQLDTHLLPGGLAVFEFGAAQGEAVLLAARTLLPDWQITLQKDLAKLNRMLQVVKPNAA